MEVTRFVYMVETMDHLAVDRRHQASSERSTLPGFDELIKVAFHALKYEI